MSEPEGMGNGLNRKLNEAVESGWTKIFARVVLPISLAIIGWFMTQALGDLKTNVRDMRGEFWQAQQAVIHTQQEMSVKIGVIGERVEENTRRLDRVDGIRNHP